MPIVKDAEYHRRYYKKNRAKMLERAAKRWTDDPEKMRRRKRESYARNKEAIRERSNAKHAELKRQSVEYLGGKCVKCGLKDECLNVYDFHHRNPGEKEFDFASMPSKIFSGRIKKELDKCELLCSNCHRKEHGCCKRKV